MAIVKLAEVCEKIGSGATPRGGKEAYCDEGISLVRSQNVLDFNFSKEGLAFINDEQAKKLSNVEVHSGDVLLNITGDSVARACLMDDDYLPARVNQHVAIIRGNSHKIMNGYVLYYLQWRKEYLLQLASAGTTRNALTKAMIEQLELDLPPLDSQQQIVAILDSLQSKIQLSQKTNDNLQQQAFSVFDNLIANAENNDCTVSDYAFLNPKRTLTKNQVARSIDMSQLSTSGAFPSGWKMKPFNGGMRFTNGDTLLARITPCLENGKTAFIDFLDDGEVAFGSTEYIVLAPKNGTPPEMLYCLARYPAFVDYAVKNMNGSSGRQRVSAETVGQYRLPLFDKHSLVLFKEVVSPMFLKMRYNSLENMRLTELRDALLPKLMSGEIDVSAVQL